VKKPDMRDPDQRDAALMHLGLDGTLADLLRLERVTDFVRAVVLASELPTANNSKPTPPGS